MNRRSLKHGIVLGMYFTRTEHYTAAVAAVAVERLALVFPCILRSPLVASCCRVPVYSLRTYDCCRRCSVDTYAVICFIRVDRRCRRRRCRTVVGADVSPCTCFLLVEYREPMHVIYVL